MAEKQTKLPLYISEIYGWLYNSVKWSSFFDRIGFLRFFTLGMNKKLVDVLIKEIHQGDKVLQIGATFGNQIDKTAEKIGFNGKYDIVDVNRFQLERVEAKYKYVYSTMSFFHQDGVAPIKDKYDVAICYLLLHELPILTKIKMVDNVLASVKDKGKVVFIDYNNPRPWHPLRYVVKVINRLYQPFAEKIWDREIHTFATKKTDFIWRKTTYFGRMYQKVVAVKKEKFKKITTGVEKVGE